MSHIPGIKPTMKDEWKKADKRVRGVFIIAIFLQLSLTAVGFVIYYIGEIAPEKYGEMIKLQTLIMFGLMGYLLATIKMRDAKQIERMTRVKNGLRYTWDEEDFDELEERVRKLEDKR